LKKIFRIVGQYYLLNNSPFDVHVTASHCFHLMCLSDQEVYNCIADLFYYILILSLRSVSVCIHSSMLV